MRNRASSADDQSAVWTPTVVDEEQPDDDARNGMKHVGHPLSSLPTARRDSVTTAPDSGLQSQHGRG